MNKSNYPAGIGSQETHWTSTARLIVLAAVLFLGLNFAQVLYRTTLPSLGWVGSDPETDETQIQFRLVSNAVGAPSLLQPGDIVMAVSGVSPVEALETFSFSQRPSGWQVGSRVRLEITRGAQMLELEAPVARWTLGAWLAHNLGDFFVFWNWFPALLVFGAGTFTFFNRPGNLSARFLFLFGLASFSITLSDSLPEYLALVFDPPAAYSKFAFSNVIFAYLLAPSFFGFSLTFPRAKGIARCLPALLPAGYMVGAIPAILLFVVPELATIGFALTALMLVLSVASLVHTGLTMQDAVSRAQMRWAVGGVTLGVTLFLLNFVTIWMDQDGLINQVTIWIADLSASVIGISLSIAILRYRLYDIDVIIRRTLSYTILTLLLSLVYFGGIVVLQNIFDSLFGNAESPLITVLSTLAIAALFNPLRGRVQEFIDRRFFRRKYDAEKALTEFAAVARDEVDMVRLSGSLLSVVESTMQPEQTSLWLRETAKGR